MFAFCFNSNLDDCLYNSAEDELAQYDENFCELAEDIVNEQIPTTNVRPIKTLQDCLDYFRLSTLLQELEESIEDVRRRRKSEKEHELFCKMTDKKMQSLSRLYHPDKVMNKGGSREDLANAERLQTALNATRNVLNVLNKVFLEDLDIDHKYGYYAKLEISSAGNEDEVKKRIFEVLNKTILLSEIKQQNIIPQIRMFLTESQSSLKNYKDKNLKDFKMHRNNALFHLEKCIEGYMKLLTEYANIEKECQNENLEDMIHFIKKISSDCSRDLCVLKELRKVGESSLKGNLEIYCNSEIIDDYFVLPFVYYINVLLMCSRMEVKSTTLKSLPSFHERPEKVFPGECLKDEENLVNAAYKLVALFNYNFKLKNKIKFLFVSKSAADEKDLKESFLRMLIQMMDVLEDRFKISNYTEGGTRKYMFKLFEDFMNIATDIELRSQNLLKKMEASNKKEQEAYEKFERVKKESYENQKKVMECLKESKLLNEQTLEQAKKFK